MQTGFKDLDKIIDINGEKLIVLGARPAMGKSILALNILSNIAIKQNKSVLYFNLETSKEEIVNRFIISKSMVEYKKFRKIKDHSIIREELTEEDWDRITYATELLKNSRIFIEDKPAISIDEMCSESRKMKNRENIQFIVIDYLQLISCEKKDCLSRNIQLKEIMRKLKALSKDLNIPILLLSQLSRLPEKRKNHRPILSDFTANKVAIDTYADIVLFLYRDAYYSNDKSNIAEIIIAKNPSGLDYIELAWMPEYLKFGNLLKVRKDNFYGEN